MQSKHTFTEFVELAAGTTDTGSPITATSDPQRAAALQREMQDAMAPVTFALEDELQDTCGCMPHRKAA